MSINPARPISAATASTHLLPAADHIPTKRLFQLYVKNNTETNYCCVIERTENACAGWLCGDGWNLPGCQCCDLSNPAPSALITSDGVCCGHDPAKRVRLLGEGERFERFVVCCADEAKCTAGRAISIAANIFCCLGECVGGCRDEAKFKKLLEKNNTEINRLQNLYGPAPAAVTMP